MNKLGPSRFATFFEAVHGHTPFPWQTMLAERVVTRGWPEGIDLPTASGKTACLDIGVFALACTADRSPFEGRSARRIFFVVDRRIIVDAAHARAQKLADALARADEGILHEVADRLRTLAAGPEPLVVSRLRGGSLRDYDWRRSPAQPAVVTGTVDQIGSRLLFRGYGAGALTASIDAALTACDSLILLDEAHCAVPFLQTARSVRRYMQSEWTEEAVAPPLSFAILSATLPDEVSDVFPEASDREAALNHYLLNQRIEALKVAELAYARKPRGRHWTLGEKKSEDSLVLDAAQRAADLAAGGHRRVAVMVNRVATAAAIHAQLSAGLEEGTADAVLMTGRMRPLDRDRLVARWAPYLEAEPQADPLRPVILVTTQCLEVGADFSFDALITECASLDALRQRFGRLNRLGEVGSAAAVVLVRREQLKKSYEDPIYGAAIRTTWEWMKYHAEGDAFDFGIAAVEAAFPEDPSDRRELMAALSAPVPSAPVMLPAHVDAWAQTAPRPEPDPDVALFLHGPDRGAPEARVVWRADLGDSSGPGWRQVWRDVMALLPPTTAEALVVPLRHLRRWLSGRTLVGISPSDVEGEQPMEEDGRDAVRRGRPVPFLIWRGREESRVSTEGRAIRPNDTIVVPADPVAAGRLGSLFQRTDEEPLDIAEAAYRESRGKRMLRIHRSLLGEWQTIAPVGELLEWGDQETPTITELRAVLQAVATYESHHDEKKLPAWLREAAGMLSKARRVRIQSHPSGGQIVEESSVGFPRDEDERTDADDTASLGDAPITLEQHLTDVGTIAARFAGSCTLDPVAEVIAEAGRLHDLGKADERFQVFLHGSELQAAKARVPLAKGDSLPRTPSQRRVLRTAARLPDGFRHEMLSMQLVERIKNAVRDDSTRDLLLHLIASHHGHARPFVPYCPDDDPPPVSVQFDGEGYQLELDAETRRQLPAAHRLDSGVAERYWRLSRRYGWWGLAYLEACLRLADWEASRSPSAPAAEQRGTANHA